MKDIIKEVKSAYAAEHGMGSWEEFMDWNTLTHTSLERMEKHMDEVISRVAKYFQREINKLVEPLPEMQKLLKKYQGDVSNITKSEIGSLNLTEYSEIMTESYYEELIENKRRIDKLKYNIQVNKLKYLAASLKGIWNPKTRLIEGTMVHGSKKGEEIKFTQFYDQYSCEWTTKEAAFRNYLLNEILKK